MAKAIPRGGVHQSRTLKYAHAGALTAGDVIVANGQVLVAVGDSAAGAVNTFVFRGPVEFPKQSALAIAPGEVCYWVADTHVNKTASANTKVGICTEAAAAADTVVLVELGENK
ncbi:DUF2190 family protein [Geoalkalibacter sp.]|uniref:DUF2190 family protein n=1 Tax=Geoalkalibacter sp. TaxID=3041440 RepID=UPI00272E73ED|nr:DUF2190 family protein [Geoalkalibacter sp.]